MQGESPQEVGHVCDRMYPTDRLVQPPEIGLVADRGNRSAQQCLPRFRLHERVVGVGAHDFGQDQCGKRAGKRCFSRRIGHSRDEVRQELTTSFGGEHVTAQPIRQQLVADPVSQLSVRRSEARNQRRRERVRRLLRRTGRLANRPPIGQGGLRVPAVDVIVRCRRHGQIECQDSRANPCSRRASRRDALMRFH